MIIFIVIYAHEENSILTRTRVNLVFFERKIFIRKLFRVQLRELRELHELGLLGRIDENHFRTRIPRNFLRFNAVYRRTPGLMLLHEHPRPVVPNDQDAIVAVGELRDWLAEDTSARPSPLRRKGKFRRDFRRSFERFRTDGISPRLGDPMAVNHREEHLQNPAPYAARRVGSHRKFNDLSITHRRNPTKAPHTISAELARSAPLHDRPTNAPNASN